MFLNKRKPAAQNKDRTGLHEAAMVGATPGQKMIGIFTAVAGSAVLLGGFCFKVMRSPAAAVAAPVSSAPSATPKLYVPLDLTATATATTKPSQRQVDMALPPGMPALPVNSAGPDRNDQPVPAETARSAETARKAVVERRLSGGFGSIDALDRMSAAPTNSPAIAMPDQPIRPLLSQPGVHGQTALSGSLVATSTPGASASRILNQHMTLVKGTSITCTLDTAIQTDQMGFAGCVTDYPVKSMDGEVVLLERGTKIDGEYARTLARGLKRISVLWTRAVTPTGVVIDLASPGTDQLGRAGLGGQVDTKFWDRYGGALMFSVLQDGIAVGTSSHSSGNTQINLGNTQATGTTAAGEILRQNSEIMSSLSLPQGTRVGITIARDLDFSGVYVLEPVAVK